jgi:prepilin-type processing-associated H-X9-DG protein
MNGYVGQNSSGTGWTSGYQQFLTLEDFNALPPSQCSIFIDEHPASINDGTFYVDMSGFDPLNPSAYVMVDFPASYHAGGAGLSFADGHADTWLWKDPRTTPASSGGFALNVPSPANRDIDCIQSATSRKINSPTR